MSAISKEQVLALMLGILYKKDGATATQTFTGIPGKTLLASGTDGNTATLAATNVPDVTLTLNKTTKLVPGMPIVKISGTGAFFATTGSAINVVHSIQSATDFKVGNFAEYVDNGLKATLATGTNQVTLTEGTTDKFQVGMKVTKITVSGENGAFNATGSYVLSITSRTTFTVGTTLGTDNTVTTAANHATAGVITFYVGGVVRNHATAGAITFAIGGIDLTNNQIPGTSNPSRQAITLATSTDTVTKAAGGTVLVGSNGGNLETANSTLSLLEQDYHFTGTVLRKKLK